MGVKRGASKWMNIGCNPDWKVQILWLTGSICMITIGCVVLYALRIWVEFATIWSQTLWTFAQVNASLCGVGIFYRSIGGTYWMPISLAINGVAIAHSWSEAQSKTADLEMRLCRENPVWII